MIILLTLSAGLPLIYMIYHALYHRRNILFDHELIFTFGYMYYWILPFIVGEAFFDLDDSVIKMWYSYYQNVTDEQKILFFITALILYLSFILGSNIAITKHRTGSMLPNIHEEYDSVIPYYIMTLCIIPIFVYVFIQIRPYLFGGYLVDGFGRAEIRGQLATLSMISFSVIYIYIYRNYDLKRSFIKNVMTRFSILYILSSIFMLSTGGRLYFMTSVVSMITLYSIYLKKLTKKRAAYIISGCFLFAGAIGVWRLSASDSELLTAIISNVFAEPILTSISLLTFISSNEIPILTDPSSSLSLVVNILPSFLFRDFRADFTVDLSDIYYYDSPLGALNSYVSWTGYFGLLGSVSIMFLGGFIMSVLKNKNGTSYHIIYGMICGTIMFTLFRDPFDISLIKVMLQDSIMIPMGFIIFLNIYNICSKRRTKDV